MDVATTAVDTVKKLDLLGHYHDLVAWEQVLATNPERWRRRCVLVNESSDWKTSEIVDSEHARYWQNLKELVPTSYPDGYLDRIVWATDVRVFPAKKVLSAVRALEPKLRRAGSMIVLFPGTPFLNSLREILHAEQLPFQPQELVNALGDLLPNFTVKLEPSGILEFVLVNAVNAFANAWPTPSTASTFSADLIGKIERETSKIDWELLDQNPLKLARRPSECPFDQLIAPLLILGQSRSVLARELSTGNKLAFDELHRSLFSAEKLGKCPDLLKPGNLASKNVRDYLLETWSRLKLRELTKVRRETVVAQSMEEFLQPTVTLSKETSQEAVVVLDLDLGGDIPNCINDALSYLQRKEITKTAQFTVRSLSITDSKCLVISVGRSLALGRPDMQLTTRIDIHPYVLGPNGAVYALNLITTPRAAYFKYSDSWYCYNAVTATPDGKVIDDEKTIVTEEAIVKRVRWNDVLEDAATNCELLVWEK